MKKRASDNLWIPFWIDKWIFGSMRIEFNVEERAVWIDLLALAAKDDGYIRANEETPYPIAQLAGMLIIPEKLLEKSINKFIEKDKIARDEYGALKIKKWEKYQLSKRRIRQMEEKEEENINDLFNKVSVKCPEKFIGMASKTGLVRVNRLVVALILGRLLTPKEEVHHRNKKENDNRPSNLILFANHKDHKRFEFGAKDVKPLWNGTEINEEMAISAIKAALKTKNNRIKKSIIKEDKKKKRSFSPQQITEWEKKFEDYYWKEYHPDGKKNKEYALKRFMSLCKKGELDSFDIGYKGYGYYLQNVWKTGFNQRVKYFSTFCTDYKEYIKYADDKPEPSL